MSSRRTLVGTEVTATLVSKLTSGLQKGLAPDNAVTAAKRFVRKDAGEAS